MKTAILTDLHANRESVQAVMEHARALGAEAFAFLGDLVGYGADPGWVVDLVREHVRGGAIAVMGNHDLAVLHGPSPAMRADARDVIEWTRGHMTSEQLRFLAALPLSQQRGNVLFVHANAYAPGEWDYIVSRIDAARSLLATECHVTFCGHMHDPRVYNMAGATQVEECVTTDDLELELSATHRWLVIPGSAGQPRDGNPAACYAIYDDVQLQLALHRVPYDYEAAAAKIRAANLPQSLAARLNGGL